ncbi:MAG: hypothetical protein IPM12_15655 [Flavobacteriales bacterium]|nr:hypothetical protein [Flavobacteriales bacterium]
MAKKQNIPEGFNDIDKTPPPDGALIILVFHNGERANATVKGEWLMHAPGQVSVQALVRPPIAWAYQIKAEGGN